MVKVIVAAAALAATALAGSSTEFPPEVLAWLDPSVDPCVDFFQYACGTWYKAAEIPPTQANTDTSFTVLGNKNDLVIQDVLNDNKPTLGEFYNSCLDTDTLDNLGIAPVQDELASIYADDITSEDLVRLTADFSKRGVPPFTRTIVQPDAKNATVNVLYAAQGTLTLSRAYYVDPTKYAAIQGDYKAYITSILILAGKSDDDAAAAVDVITSFERRMAGVQLSMVELMEVEASNYNPLTLADAYAKYPWTLGYLLEAYGLNVGNTREYDPFNRVVLNDLAYFDRAEALLQALTTQDLATILEYKVLHAAAPQLTTEFGLAYWKLFNQRLGGEKEPKSREAFCRDAAQDVLGEMVGEYFMQAAFDTSAADAADKMVNQLESAFRAGLDTADWLDAETRANAKTKVGKFTHLIGGPKNPQMYPNVELDASEYLQNTRKISSANIDALLATIGTTVQKDKFGMTPPTVNAYYSPRENQIVFPAGILQPPFFGGEYDPAQNFGAIGMVIGHEITHGFDNSGRHFDGDGNQKEWWTPAVGAAFDKKAKCIVDQYSGFEVFSEFTPNKKIGNVDGRLTLGETIADNGGLKTSFRAYTEYMKTAESPYTKETGEQLFYIAFAQGWCSKNSDKYLEGRLQNVHPPGKFRVYGAIQNNDEFARVFQCKANTTMNPAKKCHLWE
ncbi:Aste57867_4447 [Aphanomyces stellatus]|uniref:Aste57867_4447 protein n=1 Tax=Aphanomyces stellatus TaxID=120398 RepID=A0A485KFX1_9STRA|nr:hypothetical protein As57867_004435 [Aphanomyces stellatus]VFT81558.1 Aste57867_4447 [Aphanomyces stellatus]